MLKGKDAYPYEWVDSYEKIKHPSLPEKKYFYSSLRDGKRDNNGRHISDEQYLHLQNVWDTFNYNTFEDFHNHYLKITCGCLRKIYFYVFKILWFRSVLLF